MSGKYQVYIGLLLISLYTKLWKFIDFLKERLILQNKFSIV
jgi:hypothetical protein